MRAGPLRHRVTIQRRAESQDATGSVLWSWVDHATVWAAIEPIMGREYFAAAQVQSEVSVKIRMRYRDDLHSTMRIRHGDDSGSPSRFTYYEIIGIAVPRSEFRESILMCKESDAEGFRNG
jgi:SPP1 family predicted phage head-tail adaptor